MDQILQRVAQARRRLWLELFLHRLVRCWFAALATAVAAIAAPKLVAVEGLPNRWALLCTLAALAVGFMAACLWTWLRGRSQLEAAMEIDRRYGLNERVASSLSLTPAERQTPAGQALVTDAVRAIRRVDVNKRFRIHLDKRAWLPLAPAMLAFLLAVLVDNREAKSSIDPQSKQATKQQLEDSAQALIERRKQAASQGLKDAEGLFRQLEKETEKLASANDLNRKQALVKLNDLSQQLQQRRQKLGGEQELRKQFEKMNQLNRGPADKLAEAMRQGQWQKAIQELAKLKQQLERGKLDPQAQAQLEQQFQQLQEKLTDAAKARQQAMDALRKQIEAERQQGNLARAGELQQKLDQMRAQQNRLDKLSQLAQKMGDFQQRMQQGDASGATESLDQMMQQMEQIQQDLAESELLDAAMDQLEMAKDALGRPQRQGPGAGNRLGQQGGNGMGAGRGVGPRPAEKNDVGFRDSRVPQKIGRGSAVVVGEADGPNIRGRVVEAIKAEMAASGSQAADPLVTDQLPKSYREHAQEYFDLFREGR